MNRHDSSPEYTPRFNSHSMNRVVDIINVVGGNRWVLRGLVAFTIAGAALATCSGSEESDKFVSPGVAYENEFVTDEGDSLPETTIAITDIARVRREGMERKLVACVEAETRLREKTNGSQEPHDYSEVDSIAKRCVIAGNIILDIKVIEAIAKDHWELIHDKNVTND